MHQPSTPTRDYGAPALPILPPTPARGRCANCLQPITAGTPAKPVITPKAREFPNTPTPWRHENCPNPCRHHDVHDICKTCAG